MIGEIFWNGVKNVVESWIETSQIEKDIILELGISWRIYMNEHSWNI